MKFQPLILLAATCALPASPWIRLGEAPGETRVLHHHGKTLFLGADSGLYRSGDGKAWEHVIHTDNLSTIETHGQSLYAGGVHQLHRSDDGGAHWERIKFGNTSFIATARQGNRIFAAEQSIGVWRSWDNGANWVEANQGLENPVVTALAATPEVVMAGCPWGIFRSRDGGENWSQAPQSPGRHVMRLVAHQGAFYATLLQGGGVSRSSDGGDTWAALPGLAPEYVGDLEVVDGFVLASTPEGIFRYAGTLKAWTKLPGSDPLGAASLAVAGADLYAATKDAVFRLKDFRKAK